MHGELQIGLWVIFGIVLLPVYAMIFGWLFGKPRKFKPVAIGLGFIVLYIVAAIVGVALLGIILSFIL